MAAKRTKAAKAAGGVAGALETVLADLYILALKTHGFHWNVEGPHFVTLHDLFGKQYEALTDAADDVAERLRALGAYAPASFAQYVKRTNVAEETGALSAEAMLAALLADYDILGVDVQKGMDIADDADDDGTEDMLTGLLQEVQKTAWMLRATLKRK